MQTDNFPLVFQSLQAEQRSDILLKDTGVTHLNAARVSQDFK
jgi:hypothetical protein